MGQGPSLQAATKDNNEAVAAVQAAIDQAVKSLNNTIDMARAFVNSHTQGIVEEEAINTVQYSKFADEYSLDKLDSLVDGVVKGIQDQVKSTNEATSALDAIADVGEIVKSTMALFASGSTTTTNVQIVFSHILDEDNTNYAAYTATNSMSVDASNAWGNKDITVVCTTYFFAQVKPNPGVTRATNLQEDLKTLGKLNTQYDDYVAAATNPKQLKLLNFYQGKVNTIQTKIENELNQTK